MMNSGLRPGSTSLREGIDYRDGLNIALLM